MRLITARQMAAIDQQTIAGGVPGPELMERAGREIVRATLDLFPALAPPAPVAICCGKGNNGGDGLVMARLLDGLGFQVAVMVLALPEDLSADARLNYDRLPASVKRYHAAPAEWPERWSELCDEADLAVDAVFGTGIDPPVREDYAALFRAFNDQLVPTLAVDIPSGVCGDTGRVDPVAVRADSTVTVGLPKRGLLLPPGRDFVGDLTVVDIGFHDEIILAHAPDHHYLLPDTYASLLPERPSDVHKYRCGCVLIFAGSRAFGGAAVLTGLGALRSGAGLVTVAVPASLELPTRVGLPEALVVPLPETTQGTIAALPADLLASLLERKHAVAIGPGLDDHPVTNQWAAEIQSQVALPLVVDADGFSAHGRLGVAPAFASREVVVTPHAGELARVIGKRPAEIERDRFDLVVDLAKRWQATVLLKGSPSLVAAVDGSLTVNPTGDDALAHGGTGDVLTGLVAGLLAQGCTAKDAAVLGAYLHGRAGEIAAAPGSRRSVLAREVAAALGESLGELEDWLSPGPRPSEGTGG
jgi:NAD(P)H-hydrate epimerase